MKWPQQTPDGKRRWPSAIEVVTADRDRLAALNAELVGALEELLDDYAAWRGYSDDGFDPARLKAARALIAKARNAG